MKWFCDEAFKDNQGIHVIHGYTQLFKPGHFWNELYEIFENVSLATPVSYYVGIDFFTNSYAQPTLPFSLLR